MILGIIICETVFRETKPLIELPGVLRERSMNRNLVLSLCLLPFAVLPGAAGAASAEKPNIVFILADDLGYADVGFMGCKEIRTPNLDKLASSGAVLTSHYVQPVCSPTRAALMTGRYAAHTGVYTIVRPHAPWGLPLGERTLAQALHEAGYETAIVGKWHLGEFEEAYRPTRRGFDHQYGHWFGAIDYFKHDRDNIPDWHRDDQPCNDEGYSTHLIAKEACRRIREEQADKPLFLYVPFNAVHAPHQVPESYLAGYEKLTGVRRTYAGMVTAMDEAVGQIVAALEERGLKQNTLLVFSSDNGGPEPGKVTSNKPLRAGKGTLYEGGIRVCAFASWPGHIPAAAIDEPMHAVDWYPTFLKLVGAKQEQTLPVDGLDIWPVLTQKAKSPHDAILQCGGQPDKAAVRMGNWKLITGPGRDGPGAELFDLASDLGETKNLAQDQPEKVKELQAKLGKLLENAVPSGAEKADAGAGTTKPKGRKQKRKS